MSREGATEPPSLEATQRELEAARQQLAELQALLDELPGIFERKFEQRLQPFLERQRLLAEENHSLRDQLQQLLPPAARDAAAIAPAAEGRGPSLPAVQRLNRLRAASQRLMGPSDRVA